MDNALDAACKAHNRENFAILAARGISQVRVNQLALLAAQHLASARIRPLNHALRVNHQQRFGAGVEHRREPGVTEKRIPIGLGLARCGTPRRMRRHSRQRSLRSAVLHWRSPAARVDLRTAKQNAVYRRAVHLATHNVPVHNASTKPDIERMPIPLHDSVQVDCA